MDGTGQKSNLLVIEDHGLLTKFYELKEKVNRFHDDMDFFGYLLCVLENELNCENPVKAELNEEVFDAASPNPSNLLFIECNLKEEIDADSEPNAPDSVPDSALTGEENDPLQEEGLLMGGTILEMVKPSKVIGDRLYCSFCPATFRLEKSLTRHLMSHPENRKDNVSCDMCKKIFSNKEMWEQHVRRAHNMRFSCKICGSTFMWPKSVTNHQERDHRVELENAGNKEELVGLVPKESVKKVIDLDAKKRKKKKQKIPKKIGNFKCPICEISIKFEKQFNKHVQSHPEMKKGFAKCEECDESFSSKRKLEKHNVAMHGLRFGCKICGKTFLYSLSLQTHEVRHIKVNEQCKICDKVLTDKFRMVRHMRSCGRIPNNGSATAMPKELVCSFSCSICRKFEVNESRKLLDHFAEKHPSQKPVDKLEVVAEHEKFQCRLCSGVRFDTALEQAAHFRQQHSDQEKPFACPVCPSRFAENLQLRQHKLNIKHDAYDCTECGKVITGRWQRYMDHLGWHRGEKNDCDICHKSCISSVALKVHKQIKHNSNQKEKKEFICDECGKILRSSREYKDHKLSHEGHVFMCDICSKIVVNSTVLQQHMKSKHSDSVEKTDRYPCEVCGRTFGSAMQSKEHYIRMHTERTRDFACDKCDKKYLNKFDLKYHKQSHGEDAKKFICEICAKVYPRKTSLIEHRRTHTGERPFKCKMCPMDFGFRSAMYTHMRHKHLGVERKRRKKKPKNAMGLNLILLGCSRPGEFN